MYELSAGLLLLRVCSPAPQVPVVPKSVESFAKTSAAEAKSFSKDLAEQRDLASSSSSSGSAVAGPLPSLPEDDLFDLKRSHS